MVDSDAQAASETPLSTWRAFYILWAVFWALMMVVAVQDQLHTDEVEWWEPLLWEGSSGLAATFWLLMQRRIDRRYRQYLHEPVRWFAHHLKWMPLVAATFIAAVYAFRHWVYGLVGAVYEHEPWSFVIIYESIKLALFAGLWLGILFGFSSFEQWRRERSQLASLQRSLAEAHLAQLKAQLRPHFLFNALNTISALMHVDAERADRLLARLSELLRASLQSGDRERISLQEELRLLELYAQVMQERFADRVSLEWRIEDDARDAHVPALLLQPLLENAFKHGVEKSRDPVHIEIAANREGAALALAVTNTGRLHGDASSGVGLRNCRERLRVMYGEAANLTLSQVADMTCARILLPYEERAA
jgi:two-component sensor histidine kinase